MTSLKHFVQLLAVVLVDVRGHEALLRAELHEHRLRAPLTAQTNNTSTSLNPTDLQCAELIIVHELAQPEREEGGVHHSDGHHLCNTPLTVAHLLRLQARQRQSRSYPLRIFACNLYCHDRRRALQCISVEQVLESLQIPWRRLSREMSGRAFPCASAAGAHILYN